MSANVPWETGLSRNSKASGFSSQFESQIFWNLC